MEEAFIKIRFLVKNKKELEESLKSVFKNVKVIGAEIGNEATKTMNKKSGKIGDSIGSKIVSGMLGGYGLMMIHKFFQDIFKEGVNEYIKVEKFVSELRTIQSMTGSKDIQQNLLIQNMLSKSRAINPLGFFARFSEELDKANEGKGALRDFKGMKSGDAFIEFFKLMQGDKISSEDKNKIFNKVFNRYANEAFNIIANDSIEKLENEVLEIIKQYGGNSIIQEAIDEINNVIYQKQRDNQKHNVRQTVNAKGRGEAAIRDNRLINEVASNALKKISDDITLVESVNLTIVAIKETAKEMVDGLENILAPKKSGLLDELSYLFRISIPVLMYQYFEKNFTNSRVNGKR